MLMRKIKEFDSDLYELALNEASAIRWEEIPKDKRSENFIFKTSRSISFRIPFIGNNAEPKDVLSWSNVLDCIDNPDIISLYPAIFNAGAWIFNAVNGITFGRFMLVNLLPGGIVFPHVDPGVYFQKYSRFHIPLISNEQVSFSTGIHSVKEYMEPGYLYQLNNLGLHMVENLSDQNRIHIIADIEVKGGNKIF